MRKIKFRAWHIRLKKMINVDEMNFCRDGITRNGAVCVGERDTISPTTPTLYALNEIELMEYVGLEDASGVEIYEGDIIKLLTHDGETAIAEVVFEKAKFKAKYKCYDYDFDDLVNIKVIGNIYEKSI
ncbi:hypothetical protein JF116_09925 [Campylobacter fetus subsp. venerealis]|uniref:YopX family protein n=1 Tax=Campylobacter fetus TaxID=196 RepID=UPI0019096237|nr:YopX family protein [Campylobacter fetus]MBK3487695.1 hypothetical protein [Campylobacter fetus subsp. venerealis]